MKKTSKTQTSHSILQSLNVNSSLDNWGFVGRRSQKKNSQHNLSHCNSCGSQLHQFSSQPFKQIKNSKTSYSIYKPPETPVQRHIIMIPDVSNSVSQHKEGSKLSLQLNQISMGFNKENKRIQQALFQIRESTVKKQNQRFLNSISLSKKSRTSKKLNVDQSIIKILNFDNNKKNLAKKQLKKDPFNQKTKLKKRNLYELMKEQKNMLKSLGSNLRNP